MRESFLPYGHQWIDNDDIDAVVESLKADMITAGERVAGFEKNLASYCGTKYAVVVSSGTAALHCACAVAGIKNGDEVITTPITFFATVASIIFCGGTPVFADVSKDTININPKEIEKHITSKTKAIIPVDFAGHPVEIEQIVKIAKDNKLVIIEDACHALGAEYKGCKVGNLSDMTVFSLHPVKAITSGEGGVVLTDNKDYYDKLRKFRNHNIKHSLEYWDYDIEEVGYNYRISDVNCALGISQLNKLDSFIARRREIASRYNEAFAYIPEISIPTELAYVKSAYHLYIIKLRTLDREKFIKSLVNKNIGTQIHYKPAHLMTAMQRFGYRFGDFPIAEEYYSKCLSLPIFPKMTNQNVEYVIETVKELINDK